VTAYLRALYLSLVLCAVVAFIACQLSSFQAIVEFAATNLAEAALHRLPHARMPVYLDALEQRLVLLLPHLVAGLIAGVLLRGIRASTARPRVISSHRRDAWQCEIILTESGRAMARSGWRNRGGDPLRAYPALRAGESCSEDSRFAMSRLEREALDRFAADRCMPADPAAPRGETLYAQTCGEWRQAATAFGAGSLEAQLALLRHAGKLLAFRKTRDRYEVLADEGPLAAQALRGLASFRDLPDDARRELMQGLYALQTGWIAVDIPERVARALRNLGAHLDSGAKPT
jgi:hypothetical protein